ncbi:MAG: DMT family transporter [Chloroflexota bacterium]|nr:DMT family transporter [Chloroflexota bacterium]MDE2687840.1 DMT family transporter [Chloroflexota bacterium]
MLGAAMALTAAMGFGAAAVFARIGLQYMRPTTGAFVSLLIGIAITLTLALVFHFDDILALSGIAFAWFLITGTLNFPLGRLLNFTSVNKIGVSRSAPIIGAAPLFSGILGVTLGGESMNFFIFTGTLVIIGGIAMIVGQK